MCSDVHASPGKLYTLYVISKHTDSGNLAAMHRTLNARRVRLSAYLQDKLDGTYQQIGDFRRTRVFWQNYMSETSLCTPLRTVAALVGSITASAFFEHAFVFENIPPNSKYEADILAAKIMIKSLTTEIVAQVLISGVVILCKQSIPTDNDHRIRRTSINSAAESERKRARSSDLLSGILACEASDQDGVYSDSDDESETSVSVNRIHEIIPVFIECTQEMADKVSVITSDGLPRYPEMSPTTSDDPDLFYFPVTKMPVMLPHYYASCLTRVTCTAATAIIRQTPYPSFLKSTASTASMMNEVAVDEDDYYDIAKRRIEELMATRRALSEMFETELKSARENGKVDPRNNPENDCFEYAVGPINQNIQITTQKIDQMAPPMIALAVNALHEALHDKIQESSNRYADSEYAAKIKSQPRVDFLTSLAESVLAILCKLYDVDMRQSMLDFIKHEIDVPIRMSTEQIPTAIRELAVSQVTDDVLKSSDISTDAKIGAINSLLDTAKKSEEE